MTENNPVTTTKLKSEKEAKNNKGEIASTTSVLVDRVDEVNDLKEHYKKFYEDLLNKIFEQEEPPYFAPKPPLEDVILNASKALNIKHGNESKKSDFEIDKNNRQIILNGLVYKDFKKEDNTFIFIERNPKTQVELAMKWSNNEIEVEDWNNPSEWISLTDYIEKLMTDYRSLDKKTILEKRSFWEVHYKNVKRLVSDLEKIFNLSEYYNV